MKHILVVDNQIANCELLSKFLTKKNFTVATTTKGNHALQMLRQNKYDLILAEYSLPDTQGNDFFDEVHKMDPTANMILMGKEVNLKNVVTLIQKGARNFISKPLNPDELLDALQKAGNGTNYKIPTKPSPPQKTKPTPASSDRVTGNSKKARAIIEQVERVGPTNFSVIIQGETGTGKESLAHLIHQKSMRKDGPFVAVDCGCLSRELAGSELFGHEKGSFTGAAFQKVGFFEQADGGTIFLDEIANLPMDIQTALLRALQEKVIRKIGGTKEIPVDVRIIAATNENLSEKSETANFREDLYFRLCEYTLDVPSLRERPEDIPLFLDFFLEETSRELQRPKARFCKEATALLEEYDWPGNIRELRNVIRRATLFADSENLISLDSLPSRISNYRDSLYDTDESRADEESSPVRNKGDLKSTALKAESRRIMEVLEKVRYNKTRAAEVLNIHRKTLYVKLKLLNIPC
ncbi:sigma-54 dependent transcriptional regulator [Algoriphagus sp. AGSA1]|uniref:sigma-54-dependent transcriptional regulator n=1 Tax=Algoriphagus sp. AGSA1 TaxID=2907213 RepID=UPI001F30078C|nr:sigma-54 dependent transcriptional regulator [Algoriphagus sp. AGSA1]MCE7054668.1 sigma-54 dependent transcriptional regulator [Algoriphagus sp. AGSA1]